MKAASVVINILSIILYAICWYLFRAMPGMNLIWIVFLIPIVVCSLSVLVALAGTPKSGGYIFQGIKDLLFGSLLGGIFMLCVPRENRL